MLREDVGIVRLKIFNHRTLTPGMSYPSVVTSSVFRLDPELREASYSQYLILETLMGKYASSLNLC